MNRALLKNMNFISGYKAAARMIAFLWVFTCGSLTYSQGIKKENELIEAIENVKSGSYEDAIPILRKYSEAKGKNDFTKIQSTVYLNFCYLVTKKEIIKIEELNTITDLYIRKNGVSKIDSKKRNEEIGFLFYLSAINGALGDNSKMVSFLEIIRKEYDTYNSDKLDGLYSQVLRLLTRGHYNLENYESAIEVGQIAYKLNADLLGESNNSSLEILDFLYLSYQKINQYDKALPFLQKEVDIGKGFWGEKHPEYLSRLKDLGITYSNSGYYEKALEINIKVVELYKEVFGGKSPEFLIALNTLALAYSNNGEDIKALNIAIEVVELQREVLGINDPKFINSLNNLASIHLDLGDFSKALEINLEVIELSKKVIGEKHPDYAKRLSALALVYSKKGDYQKALEINLKSNKLLEEILGDTHPEYLTSLSNLAVVYSKLGEYKKSLDIDLKVSALRKELLGENHPEYLTSLANLASDYLQLGDFSKALETNLKTVYLLQKVLSENHPAFLTALSNLSYTYSSMGNFIKALEISNKVVGLKERIHGKSHNSYLISLLNLSNVYLNVGDFQKSLELGLIVEKSFLEKLGPKNPLYINSIANLASVYRGSGNYKEALRFELQVAEFRTLFFGRKHPEYISSLNNLAFTEFYLSDYNTALNHLILRLNLTQERVIVHFTQLTEYQREQFWNKSDQFFRIYPLFLEKKENPQFEEINLSYNIALFTKGLLLSTTLDFNRLLEEKGAPEVIEKYEDLKRLKLQIERINEKPIADRNLNVDSLETIAQKLEIDLVKLSKEYGDYTRNLKITWEEVQSNLGEKDVAIEFLEYPTLTDTVKYAALVLRRGWENPKFVPLFRKDQIDEIVNRDPNQIYFNGIIGKETRKLVWDPLEEYIAPGDKVHFSAAGILHQLAIENLSYDESSTIGDRYQMYRLSSTKELALQKPQLKSQNVALYGGIKYDLSLDQMIAGSEKYEPKDSFLAVRGINQDSLDRKGLQFLPGTLAEANEVGDILRKNKYQVTEFIGESGSEESLKDLSGKKTGIIHIATHGFFLPVEQSKRNPFIQMRFDDRNANAGYVDPMLRSGLLLAGGNRAWQGDSIPDTIEDGVLTAKEISNLDLRETDLVVLSACETGLGDVSSEGVFGLQRAFKQAGAQTIIMSLWNVNDEATQYLMTNFYSYLTQGASKREAFIQARNKCRERYQDPESWAAFIMLD
jgi:CHAT domain-containing protein